jgi:hypothetical protein
MRTTPRASRGSARAPPPKISRNSDVSWRARKDGACWNCTQILYTISWRKRAHLLLCGEKLIEIVEHYDCGAMESRKLEPILEQRTKSSYRLVDEFCAIFEMNV